MAELGFRDHRSSGYTTRDASPDSVIFTLDSSFSLFYSASASADRCSFASDALDHDSFPPEFSPHLAGRGGDNGESRTGPDRDPNKALTVQKHSRLSRLAKKLIAKDARIEDGPQLLNSARNSFSLAVKDCQDRRSRSEALSQKLDRRRTASLDLKDDSAFSPRLGDVKKSSGSSHKYGAFPSPGTPPYLRGTVGMQKGWSSERVPSSTNGGRRQQVGTAVVPLNSGRTLPSKWEDAERWIFNPVSRNGSLRKHIVPPQRRPKSKSGPLGPLGLAYYSLYSPAAPMFEKGIEGSFVVGSPFSAGVIAADGSAIFAGDYAAAFQVVSEPCMARSVSVHGCSNRQNQLPLPSQGDNIEGLKDAATDISRAVSRWDVATQMSPQGSTQSSLKRRPSFSSSTPTALHIVELQSVHCSNSEVRDVQVDERVTMTSWSNKHGARQGRRSGIVDDWRMGTNNGQDSAWDVSESAKSISKLKREEAQITAWENLQKAKAEAAIRKLEMKLEKKRSSSMDKIMDKLKSAQKKAQEMRSSMVANQAGQVTRTCHKAISFHRARNIGSLSGCFTAFNCMLPSA